MQTTSKALAFWRTTSQEQLDELVAAHRAVGGGGRGRRYATEQLNHAYLVAVGAQFQRFCRDLHTESAQFLAGKTTPESFRPPLLHLLTDSRKLDRGNATAGNIGADFNRFGLPFWDRVLALDRRNVARKHGLERLNIWRNAIAHQDFDIEAAQAGTKPQLAFVRVWRRHCCALAEAFERVMSRYLGEVVGTRPWR